MISPVSSTAFSIGSFPVKFYSLTMFAAIFCGAAFTCFISRKYYKNVDTEKILDILPLIVISAILGARIYYVILDWNYFSSHLGQIFMIWNGGLSIHGALIGGFLAGLWCVKKYKLDLWIYADVFSYGLLLGQAIGRFGNYFNTEAFGKPCFYSQAFCLYVPVLKRPLDYLHFDYFHPAFLYEAIWNLFALLILIFVVRKLAKNTQGVVFFSYLILYSLGRLFVENIRLDSVLNIGKFHVAELVSFFIILFSTGMIIFLKQREKKL